MLLKVAPPPAKVTPVLELSVALMVEVFWFNVRPVVVDVSQTVPVPLRVQVPDPMVMVRVLVLAEETLAALTVKLLALNVPAVTVRAPLIAMLAPEVKLDVPLSVTLVMV